MNTTLHIPKNGLNIDRAILPQIKSTDVQDFVRWLKSVKHTSSMNKDLPVASLIPSQGNFNTHKIHELMGHKRENLKKPIIVSSDHHIVDGHHRWLALLNMDQRETIPVIQINLKINDLLAAMNEYPKSFKKTVVESFKEFICRR